ncbi:MAG: hypothetical protein M3526_07435, partial [Actinomycetota bacterium]|nr:hypothetical protein [Actinomycetota bacterium]
PTPSPDPAPEPTPDPGPGAPAPTPGGPTNPTSPGLFGPGATSEFNIGESAENDPGVVRLNEESVQGGAGSLFIESVASILDELASSADSTVRAAEGTSSCLGPQCGSTFDSLGSKALAIILISVILAVVAALATRAGRRRSSNEPATKDA